MCRVRGPRLEDLHAAWWAWRATGAARRELRLGSVAGLELPPAPPIGPGSQRAVAFALRRRGATCLESALVRQAILAARGVRREVVIGVAKPGGVLRAHAWLEGDPVDARFTELARGRG